MDSNRGSTTAVSFSDQITIPPFGSSCRPCLLENLNICDHPSGPKVNDMVSTEERRLSVPLGVKETNEECLSRVNTLKDGSSDDLDGYLATGVSYQYPPLPFSKGRTYSLDLERANKQLKHHRYFLVFGQDGLATAYCWAVDAQASQISHTYRVEGGDKIILHFCSTFNHSEPDVGLRARALGHEFFLPHVELRRLPANNGEYMPTLVYYDGRQALMAANEWNTRFASPNSDLDNRFALELVQLLTQLADKGLLDQRDVRLQQPKPLSPSAAPQSELPTYAWYAPQNASSYSPLPGNQGDSTIGSPSHSMANGLSGLDSVSTQELVRISGNASGCQPYPEISTSPHDTAQYLPNSGAPSDRWPDEQIMRIMWPEPNLQSIKKFVKEFSAKLKQQRLKVAYCQYCRDVNRKSAEECALKDLRPWNLERHLQAHYKVHKFACPVCRKGTVTKQQRKEHIKKKHPDYEHPPNL